MSGKSYPINCAMTKKPLLLAKIGFNDYVKPVIWLWCKFDRLEHTCTLANMLQSWRDIAKGDRMALSNYQAILKKAVCDIEADIEDCRAEENT